MILNQHGVDNVDKVQLITAMMAANVAEDRLPEGEIARISGHDTGDFGVIADTALGLIAVMHRQSADDFDGVVWFERFENSERGSLADVLVEFLVDFAIAEDDVRESVVEWLADRHL